MITLDTSGLLALLNRRDPAHGRATEALDSDLGPYLVPTGILAEITYMVEQRLGPTTLDLFLQDLESSAYALECGLQDLPRIRVLIARYADLPLGFADASVEACGGRVLTLDVRDFEVVAREGTILILPD